LINSYRLSITRHKRGWKVLNKKPLMTWFEGCTLGFERSLARCHGMIVKFKP
jgi:hypothetical protein